MANWAKEHLLQGQTFEKSAAVQWFAKHYPRIKSNTINMHVEAMSVNNRTARKCAPNIKPGSGHDLFYKVGPNQFRLWLRDTDPAPIYKEDIARQPVEDVTSEGGPEDEPNAGAEREFAFERDLRNYLVKNLALIEPGLRRNCSPLDRSVHPDCMIGTPASAARRASIAVRPCNRPVAMTLAAAA
jgi:hypothetical protein